MSPVVATMFGLGHMAVLAELAMGRAGSLLLIALLRLGGLAPVPAGGPGQSIGFFHFCLLTFAF